MMAPVQDAISGLDDEDLDALTPTRGAAMAGGATLASGLFTLLMAAQTFLMTRFVGMVRWVIPLMLLFGLASLILGWQVRKMRGWASLAASIVSGSWAALTGAWALFSLLNGLLSALPALVVPLAGASLILCALSIGPGKRADLARRRFREQGLEVF